MLQFDRGITAIVGPNGCGKSNLTDAVLWALGEPHARALRAPVAAELIFSGGGRRPANYAQVSLLVDNEDGALPVEQSEVEVVRRVDRSGESQSWINGARARLRDVQELFLASGVGRQSYAFIAQSQINALITQRPEVRREMIEEAAGTSKYRFKRQETLRRLERTEANLERAGDVLAEVVAQIEPLKDEAEKAKEYKAARERLNRLEYSYLAHELRDLEQAAEKLRGEEEALQAELSRCQAQRSQQEAAEETWAEQVAQVGRELETVRTQAEAATRQAAAARGEAVIAQERGEAALAREAALRKEIEELTAALSEADERLRVLAASREEVQSACEAAREQRARLVGEISEVAQELARASEEVADASGELESAKQRMMSLEQEQKFLGTAISELEGEAEQVACWQAELIDAKESAARLRERMRAAEEGTIGARSLLESARLRAARLRERILVLQRELSAMRELAADEREAESGVRAVLRAACSGAVSGVLGMVSQLVQPEPEAEQVVKALLARYAHHVVVQDERALRECLTIVGEEHAGPVGFIPLSSLNGDGKGNGTPLEDDAEFTPATELVSATDEMAPLVEHLLGDALVCPDLQVALSARSQANDCRIATRNGEILYPSGEVALRPGLPLAEHDGWAAARAERLAADIARTERALRGVEARMQARAARLREACDQGAERREAFAQAREQVARLEGALRAWQVLAANKAAHTESERGLEMPSELERIHARKRELEQAVAHARQTVTEACRRYDEAVGVAAKAKESLGSLEQEKGAVEITIASLEERLSSVSNAVDISGEQRGYFAQSVREKQDEADRCGREALDLAAGAERLGQRANELEQQAASLSGSAQMLRSRQEEITARAARSRAEAKALLQEISDHTGALQGVALRRARAESSAEVARQRLMEEYGWTPDAPVASPEPIVDYPAAGREVRALRARLKELGDVNLGAILHYTRLWERKTFLQQQILDLAQAREDMLRIIEEIDQRSQAAFLETFAKVQEAFNETFQRLFDGGSAWLELSEPENLLESGVRISVRLPGRERQTLSALSGGERTLTGIAFLFGLMKVRPCPFCILDEVEAALDDENVRRFTGLLREFSQRTQFLLVTHNKITMQEADSLWGVTMTTSGPDAAVSKIYSLRLPREEASVTAQAAP